MVRKLVRALDAIDYPRAKLDIKLVVERRDTETLAAIASLGLPARYDVIVAPPGQPSTKPRALNVALPAASRRFGRRLRRRGRARSGPTAPRGGAFRRRSRPRLSAGASDDRQCRGFLDQHDVRDRIRGAVRSRSIPGSRRSACRSPSAGRPIISARGRCGASADGTPGTSPRTPISASGSRARARASARSASDTREEAPNDLGAWFRQRMRWQKGWMQTLIVHSRHPVKFVRALGPARALAAAALIAGSVLGGLFGPPLLIEALWRAFRGDLAGASAWRLAGDVAIYTLMALGLMSILVPALVAMRRRGLATLEGALASLPVYYMLISARELGRLVRSGDPAVSLGQDRARPSPRRDARARRRARPPARRSDSLRIESRADGAPIASTVPVAKSLRRGDAAASA